MTDVEKDMYINSSDIRIMETLSLEVGVTLEASMSVLVRDIKSDHRCLTA